MELVSSVRRGKTLMARVWWRWYDRGVRIWEMVNECECDGCKIDVARFLYEADPAIMNRICGMARKYIRKYGLTRIELELEEYHNTLTVTFMKETYAFDRIYELYIDATSKGYVSFSAKNYEHHGSSIHISDDFADLDEIISKLLSKLPTECQEVAKDMLDFTLNLLEYLNEELKPEKIIRKEALIMLYP